MVAILLWLAAGGLLTSFRWLRKRWLQLFASSLACIAILFGGYFWWYEHRPIPGECVETWFDGVRYTRIVRKEPHPLIVHIVTIDLAEAGIEFLVTPPEEGSDHPLRGQTTSAFLERHQLQVAINGSFFHPWHARGPLDYYPHVGDPVSVHGLGIANGRTYSQAEPEHNTLFLMHGGRAAIGKEVVAADNAISGREIFLKDGELALAADIVARYATLEPRTAVALSQDERTLLLCVVDGRQPNYSEGVTLEELAKILREHGGWTALHLDGGGSSTLVRAGTDGRPSVVNSPIHGRHPPGRERPVANHLGVFAKGR